MSKILAVCVILFAVLTVATAEEQRFNFTIASISDIQGSIRQGYMTCRQIIQGYLDRIEKYGRSSPTTTGAITNTNPNALKEADDLDKFFEKNNKLKGRLHCAPLVAKDCIDVAGIPTTNGLNAFNKQIPLKDATVVKNCKDQGAIFIAKANMSPLSDKEAWGHSETGGLIRNPFALGYTTYGSSGGNSASANAMLAVGGIAGETGVSINLPSSTGNLVGFRPPVDLLNACKCREGVMPNNFYQDVVGPIARRAEDAILIFDGMIGKEGEYASAVMNPRGLNGMKVNIFQLMAYGTFPFPPMPDYTVDPKIMDLFTVAADNLVNAGATVKNFTADFMSTLPIIGAMFASGTASCIPGWRKGYFEDATRFGQGAFHSVAEIVAAKTMPAYYQNIWEDLQNQSSIAGKCENETKAFLDAQAALIDKVITPLLAGADIAVWPTLPVFPAKLGQDAFDKDWGSATVAPINMVLLASWSAYPSVTVPLGFSDPSADAPQGLPIGLFMMTTPDKFPTLLKAAYAYQQNFGISKFPADFINPPPPTTTLAPTTPPPTTPAADSSTTTATTTTTKKGAGIELRAVNWFTLLSLACYFFVTKF